MLWLIVAIVCATKGGWVAWAGRTMHWAGATEEVGGYVDGLVVLVVFPFVEGATNEDFLLEADVFDFDGAIDLEAVEEDVLQWHAVGFQALTELEVVAGWLPEVEWVDGYWAL